MIMVSCRHFLWCYAGTFCGVMQILFMVSCGYFLPL